MLKVELFLSGSEYYFKSENEQEDLSIYEPPDVDFDDLEPDSEEAIGHLDLDLGLEIELKGEKVYSESRQTIGKDGLDLGMEIITNDESWHDIAEADDEEQLVIWGHSGTVYVCLVFANVFSTILWACNHTDLECS